MKSQGKNVYHTVTKIQTIPLMSEKKLSRKVIIKTLINSLEPIYYIHAFWEGGAAAFNSVDQRSEIDLYLVVDDERIMMRPIK